MTLKKKWIIGSMGILLVTAGVLYEIVVPNKYASTYQRQLQANTKKLDAAFWDTANTQALPIFTGTNMVPAENIADLTKVEAVIAKNKAVLAQYAAVDSLKKLPLSGYTSAYSEAKEDHTAAKKIAAEAQKRLEAYQVLITYYVATCKVNKEVFDTMTDFTKLAADVGNSVIVEGIKHNAQVVRKSAVAYENIKAPKEAAANHAKLVALTYELADALDERSVTVQGTDVAKDQAAMQKVNDVTIKTDQFGNDSAKQITSAAVIRNIRELPKLTH